VIALTGAFLFLATSSVKAFVGRQMQQEAEQNVSKQIEVKDILGDALKKIKH